MAVTIDPAFIINPAKTAVLIIDYENDMADMLAEDVRGPFINRASTILKVAYQAKLQSSTTSSGLATATLRSICRTNYSVA